MKPSAATLATLSNWQQRFFYMHHPTDRIAHTTAFVKPVVEHWLERNSGYGHLHMLPPPPPFKSLFHVASVHFVH